MSDQNEQSAYFFSKQSQQVGYDGIEKFSLVLLRLVWGIQGSPLEGSKKEATSKAILCNFLNVYKIDCCLPFYSDDVCTGLVVSFSLLGGMETCIKDLSLPLLRHSFVCKCDFFPPHQHCSSFCPVSQLKGEMSVQTATATGSELRFKGHHQSRHIVHGGAQVMYTSHDGASGRAACKPLTVELICILDASVIRFATSNIDIIDDDLCCITYQCSHYWLQAVLPVLLQFWRKDLLEITAMIL